MLSRLFCTHCEEYYQVDLDNIKFVQQFMHKNIKFANNTYYYKNGCFFKELKRLKASNIKEKKMKQNTLEWLKKNEYDADNINLQGNYGNSALMKASREGDAQLVADLLDAGADIHLKNIDGNKALWLACFGENPEVVKLLLDAGIEVDTSNVNGVTPLMYAASSGKESMVKMLIDAKSDVSIKNPDDFTALDLAVTPKILKMLRAQI